MGLLLGVPEEQYHDRWEVSQSDLKTLLQGSPLHFWHAKFAENRIRTQRTEAMTIGAMVDCLTFEPDEFGKRFQVAPEGLDARTKAGKAQLEELAESRGDRELVKYEHFLTAKATAGAIFEHPVARGLLKPGAGISQATITWTDRVTGIVCRGRPDRIIPGRAVIDLKKARSGRPNDFSRQAFSLGYHVQAGFYLDGLAECGLADYSDADQWPWIWVAIEDKPPHAAAVYTAKPSWVELGRQTYRKALDTIAECMRKNHWPSYTETILELDAPRWAYMDNDLATEVTE